MAALPPAGVTRQKADPWDIDHRANLALLRSAEKHDAECFTFVNVIGYEACPAQLTKAKAAFAAALRDSTVPGQIINPSGYFSDLEVLHMAKRGRVYVLQPDVRINPIHGADLARFCVDRLLDGDAGEWDVGGPEIFTCEASPSWPSRPRGVPRR